jgi:hypothetical protein
MKGSFKILLITSANQLNVNKFVYLKEALRHRIKRDLEAAAYCLLDE